MMGRLFHSYSIDTCKMPTAADDSDSPLHCRSAVVSCFSTIVCGVVLVEEISLGNNFCLIGEMKRHLLTSDHVDLFIY